MTDPSTTQPNTTQPNTPGAPSLALAGIVLGSPDPQALGRFYARLLGWPLADDHPLWVTLAAPPGSTKLSFQQEDDFVSPVWPARPGDQAMQVHLDIHVEDLDAAGRWAEAGGARLADFQPQDHVRVYLDPHGHPFCLFR